MASASASGKSVRSGATSGRELASQEIRKRTHFLYYPHAPILLCIVRHVKRSGKADGGYRWKSVNGSREGFLGNTEAERQIKVGRLMVIDQKEAIEISQRLDDMIMSRLAYSRNRATSGRLTSQS